MKSSKTLSKELFFLDGHLSLQGIPVSFIKQLSRKTARPLVKFTQKFSVLFLRPDQPEVLHGSVFAVNTNDSNSPAASI